jgi:chemotaxis protein methyltransferase CheR
VWQPSCAGGDELYALAIVLYEAGLLPRVRIYATDIHKAVYQPAERGVFPLGAMAASAANYEHAGGTASLAEYYTVDGDQAVMKPWLREQIVFSEHSLAADEGFNAFQLILCRHTWESYNPSLQDRVLTLFERSLCRFGMLGVGRLRIPRAVTDAARFQEIGSGWYRKQSKRTDLHAQ